MSYIKRNNTLTVSLPSVSYCLLTSGCKRIQIKRSVATEGLCRSSQFRGRPRLSYSLPRSLSQALIVIAYPVQSIPAVAWQRGRFGNIRVWKNKHQHTTMNTRVTQKNINTVNVCRKISSTISEQQKTDTADLFVASNILIFDNSLCLISLSYVLMLRP